MSDLAPVPFELIAEQISTLHGLGLRAVPCCWPLSLGFCRQHGACSHAGKVPLIQGFNQRPEVLPTLDQTIELFRSRFPCNLAAAIDRPLMVLDADSPAAHDEILDRTLASGLITPTRAPRPGRGPAYLFDGSGLPALAPHVKRGSSGAIDVLTLGGILVLPPSVHATGHVLAWTPGLELGRVPVVPLPDALVPLVESTPRRIAHPDQSISVSATSIEVSLRMIQASAELSALWAGRKSWGDSSESGVDFALATKLVQQGINPSVVAAVLGLRPGVHRNTAEYLTQTVANAAARIRRS